MRSNRKALSAEYRKAPADGGRLARKLRKALQRSPGTLGAIRGAWKSFSRTKGPSPHLPGGDFSTEVAMRMARATIPLRFQSMANGGSRWSRKSRIPGWAETFTVFHKLRP